MTKHEDFLFEIHTEELPPKALLKLAHAFCQEVKERLKKIALQFTEIHFFATPCRLAVLVKELAAQQKEQLIERRGPALAAAFDAEGQPTPACLGFARSCGVDVSALITIKNQQGEWVGICQQIPGKTVAELLPTIIEQALMALPIPKRMRWGQSDVQFVRPIHSMMMLYGAQLIAAKILACETGRVTRGHRFHAPEMISIPQAEQYESLLQTKAYIVADFAVRQKKIMDEANNCLRTHLQNKGSFVASQALLDEVTGLVEWPCALLGQFDAEFLQLPEEVLISAMQDHQRYFPVRDENNQLMEYFITISNIQSRHPLQVILGNQRVLRARLSDAAFFYESDKKESLEKRVASLQGIIFQAKLGTLFDKAERISRLAEFIAKKLNIDSVTVARAGLLAKTDLTTQMVGEFPELQGVMGQYYALHDGEEKTVALAIKEHYLPRFAGDKLPESNLGQAVALADRVDTLVGAFSIHQQPTGDKDPYGLRRAALGVLRILIEKEIDLNLNELLDFSAASYQLALPNTDAIPQLLVFIQERLRAWYLDQGISADVFAAVAALGIANPLDVDKRIAAVQAFKKLAEAEALSVANRRVNNILSKYNDAIDAKKIDADFFEQAAETELAEQLQKKSEIVDRLSQSGNYTEVLLQLAELRKPIDDFFDQVMVMTENKSQRENRILLLNQLRNLFLQVADIALLQ